MKLILGLGNPEKDYGRTRHNFGFRVLDSFAGKFEFPAFKLEKKFKAEISEKEIKGEKIFLVKPQTFMNLSGEAAAALLNFYKPKLEDFLVVFDDVDLPFGSLRFREDGSSGGHNGIKNLIAHFGTENFARLKLGTANELLDIMPTDEFVLAKFTPAEEKAIPEILEKAVDGIEKFLENESENLTL
ncbi:MAG: aminoacyl-tRNA hydrolase [Candidatus Peribacteraceae bacterium]|nr:aminoacyl-tRNA hydrolase [Candidatus Peribacteraceae bacterium]